MTKFSKLFAVTLLVSSVAVFAAESDNEKDGVSEVTTPVVAAIPVVTPTPEVKPSLLDKAKAKFADAGTFVAEKATAGYEKAKYVAWDWNLFEAKDGKELNIAQKTANVLAKARTPLVIAAAVAVVAYVVHKATDDVDADDVE